MSDVSTTNSVATVEDPFRLGWRYVREVDQTGQEVLRQVPLTERDLLFPQEGDFVVHRRSHTSDLLYLTDALSTFLRDRPAIQVFSDHRIDFNLRGVEPLGPDVAVLDEIEDWDDNQGTVYLAQQGRPLLVVEITSPDTRGSDHGVKRRFYERAGVPIYVIVDHQAGESGQETHLLVLRLGNAGYLELPPNNQGLVRMPSLRLSLMIEDDRIWVHDHLGRRFEEMPDLYARVETLEAREAEHEARIQELEVLYEVQVDRCRQETAARQEAEQARQEAERQLAAELQARLSLEERLRQLEEQLRQRDNAGGAS